jgi:hypothetical protein
MDLLAGRNGIEGYEGDGAQATLAKLHAPFALHYDKGTGRKFFTEIHKCSIRMIDDTGVITTIAGAVGSCGLNVDGAALSTKLWKPFALSMDSAGRLLIADFGNNRIRQLTVGGDMITIAGGGVNSVEDGDNELAENAHVSSPSGIWVDQYDNIYIAESYGNRVRQIKAADHKIYNMVGSPGSKGTAETLWHPRGIWGDESIHYKLYIPDTLSRRIVTMNLPLPAPSSFPSSSPSYIAASSDLVTVVAGVGATGGSAAEGVTATSVAMKSPSSKFQTDLSPSFPSLDCRCLGRF